MVRVRILAAVLVAAVLAALPVLRSACDLDCVDPGIGVPGAARASTAASPESHCPQHADGTAPAAPAPKKDDGCGHDHQAQRMTAARTMQVPAGVEFAPVPAAPVVSVNAHTVVSGTLAPPPPMIRPPAASAPLRI
jgi:hypothetical protein